VFDNHAHAGSWPTPSAGGWGVTELMIHIYWAMAVLFSMMFAWQLLAMVFGGHGGGADHDAGGGHDAGGHDAGGHDAAAHHADQASDATASFKLVSLRSIVAFGLLFGWAGVLYTKNHTNPEYTILYSLLWGVAGMLLVSLLFYFMLHLSETGTQRIGTSVGERGTVYMDIPAGGTGKVRVMMSGMVSMVDARVPSGEALKAGTPIVVKKCLDASTVEVEKAAE
jgi:membrane protein implicated in regulation of membrane protease activity